MRIPPQILLQQKSKFLLRYYVLKVPSQLPQMQSNWYLPAIITVQF